MTAPRRLAVVGMAFLLGSACGIATGQEVYESVDTEGNASFSDQPSANAESIVIPPTNTVEPVSPEEDQIGKRPVFQEDDAEDPDSNNDADSDSGQTVVDYQSYPYAAREYDADGAAYYNNQEEGRRNDDRRDSDERSREHRPGDVDAHPVRR